MQFTQQPLLGEEEALLIKAQGPDGFRLQSAKCNMRGGEGEVCVCGGVGVGIKKGEKCITLHICILDRFIIINKYMLTGSISYFVLIQLHI